jgi:hypothetical protein
MLFESSSSRAIALSALVVLGGYATASAIPFVYTEVSGIDFGSFNPVPPAGVAEISAVSGFGGRFDRYGRVLANANVTDQRADGSFKLDRIQPGLWTAGDADLFKFRIEDPASFSAHVNGTAFILALFDANGVALGATRGGTIANALTDAALAASLTPGDYYIGVATGGAVLGVPRNNANQALFDFTTNGVKDPVAGLADYTLSTDPFIAWTIAGTPPFLLPGTSNFTGGANSHIHLSGANFAIPEPASLTLIAAGALALRRRRLA